MNDGMTGWERMLATQAVELAAKDAELAAQAAELETLRGFVSDYQKTLQAYRAAIGEGRVLNGGTSNDVVRE